MDKSPLSRELIAEFRESGYFSVISYLDRYNEIDPYLDAGKAKVAIVIPYNFSKNMRTGRNAQVEVILDGGDSNTANIAQGYVAAISAQYARRTGISTARPLIDSRSRVWYNTELKSRNFIIPGLIAVIMSVIIALLTSLTIAREWDRGTMEQLMVTPIRPIELMLGKTIPFAAIGFVDMLLVTMLQ
jgi:ABC-2 type transport system permease protein